MKISKSGIIAAGLLYALSIVVIAILALNVYSSNKSLNALLEDAERREVVTETTSLEVESEEVTTAEVVEAQGSHDTKAPVITGVHTIEVHVGETVAFKSGVSVTDDTDPNPSLTIDNSDVDLSSVGEYYVIYIATDSSGNTAYQVGKVDVLGAQAVTSDEANEYAQEVLSWLVNDEMNDEQKITAVYDYLRTFGYVDEDYGLAADYHTNGYYFLKTMRGNCRCFYGASRLLLENLGYKCIGVNSRPLACATHYWNLVSIDGGENYYHYDPTCWAWEGPGDINMVCDDWLLAYAQYYEYDALEWVQENYPPTPKKNLFESESNDYIWNPENGTSAWAYYY